MPGACGSHQSAGVAEAYLSREPCESRQAGPGRPVRMNEAAVKFGSQATKPLDLNMLRRSSESLALHGPSNSRLIYG